MTPNTPTTTAAGTSFRQIPSKKNPDDELPPGLVEEIHDDPAKMAPMARKFAAESLYEMYREMPSYTPSQKRDFVDLCARLGDLDPKKRAEVADTGGVSITINIPQIGTSPSSTLTIDQKAVVVPDKPIFTLGPDPEFEVVDE